MGDAEKNGPVLSASPLCFCLWMRWYPFMRAVVGILQELGYRGQVVSNAINCQGKQHCVGRLTPVLPTYPPRGFLSEMWYLVSFLCDRARVTYRAVTKQYGYYLVLFGHSVMRCSCHSVSKSTPAFTDKVFSLGDNTQGSQFRELDYGVGVQVSGRTHIKYAQSCVYSLILNPIQTKPTHATDAWYGIHENLLSVA